MWLRACYGDGTYFNLKNSHVTFVDEFNSWKQSRDFQKFLSNVQMVTWLQGYYYNLK